MFETDFARVCLYFLFYIYFSVRSLSSMLFCLHMQIVPISAQRLPTSVLLTHPLGARFLTVVTGYELKERILVLHRKKSSQLKTVQQGNPTISKTSGVRWDRNQTSGGSTSTTVSSLKRQRRKQQHNKQDTRTKHKTMTRNKMKYKIRPARCWGKNRFISSNIVVPVSTRISTFNYRSQFAFVRAVIASCRAA